MASSRVPAATPHDVAVNEEIGVVGDTAAVPHEGRRLRRGARLNGDVEGIDVAEAYDDDNENSTQHSMW